MIHPCSNTHTNTHATPTDFLIHSNYSACYYCLILLSRSLYLCSFFIPLLINSASFCSHFSILQLVVNRRRIQKFCWFTRSNYMDSISYKGWNDLFSFHSSHSLPFTFAIYFPLPILYFCKYYIFASSLLPHASLLLVSSIISISSFFSIFPYTSCSRTNSIWLRI